MHSSNAFETLTFSGEKGAQLGTTQPGRKKDDFFEDSRLFSRKKQFERVENVEIPFFWLIVDIISRLIVLNMVLSFNQSKSKTTLM